MPEQFYDVATYAARDSVGYLVRRLTAIISARVEAAFASQRFTLTQWSVLMHLRDGLARTASDLACAFQHDSGALTRVLDQLERRGLIGRRRSSTDRRVVVLELTPAGRRAIDLLLPTVVETLNAVLAPLTAREFDQFRATLVKVLDHVVDRRALPAASPAPASPMRRRPAAVAARRATRPRRRRST